MGVRLGNGNWAVKTSKLLAYNDASGMFLIKSSTLLEIVQRLELINQV